VHPPRSATRTPRALLPAPGRNASLFVFIFVFIYISIKIFLPIYISSRLGYRQSNMKTEMKTKSEAARAGSFVRGSERTHQAQPGPPKSSKFSAIYDSQMYQTA